MSDFSSSDSNRPPPGGNQPEMTVSELSLALKRVVEGSFERVRVRGEISGFKQAGSGHLYMSLKDETAVLDAVCWRGVAGRLALRPEDGMEVVATGRLTTYPARSRYQIVIESLELAGEGALLKLLEDRRRKLAAEGLFDEARKRPLPFLPEVIGVVTSPTGAVIRDILHRLADRFPRRVLLWPVLVQGEGAAEQVAAAIEGFNRLEPAAAPPRPDLLIVARGGGSLEDLWAFNEEAVVRAAAASRIPLISAVGHETDTTLIDFASDRRAPTPSAAAEIAVPVRADLLSEVMDYTRRMAAGAGRLVEEHRVRVEGLGRGLPDPARLLEDKTQRLDDRAERLANAAATLIAGRRALFAEWAARLPHPRQQMMLAAQQLAPEAHRLDAAWRRFAEVLAGELESLGRVLESTSYRTVLKRGFAVVHGPDGPIARAAGVAPGMALALEFADGRARARAEGATPGEPGGKRKGKTRRARSPDDGSQGTLL
jgi:exodeoxyribonuclease VII large subunit